MNTIRQWISAKPFTAVLLATFFGATATAAGLRDDWLPYTGALFCIGLVVLILSMWRFTGIMLAALMALSTQAEADEPKAEAPVGVAVVVVVVGGVCVYLLARTCQRLFPKTPAPSTNEPPSLNVNGRPDDTAASWSYYGVVSCYEPQFEQWPQVTLELSGTIEENEHGPFFALAASKRMTGTQGVQDYDAFQADLARHGITMGPVGTMNYGRNGRPAYEQETPIRFSESGSQHTVTVHADTGPSVPMVVQRSFDLKTWTDFGFVCAPVGQRFTLIDTTTRQAAFYRIQQKP